MKNIYVFLSLWIKPQISVTLIYSGELNGKNVK